MRLGILAFAAGILLLQQQAVLPPMLVVAGLVAAGAGGVWLAVSSRSGWARAAVVLACAALGFSWAAWRAELRLADELSMLEGDFTGAELARWTRERFLRHWRETRYFRMLNRMLFRAARPEERWRVFAHFYRLPPQRIARFYAGQLTALDRMRILSGRPPVSIGAALKALLG